MRNQIVILPILVLWLAGCDAGGTAAPADGRCDPGAYRACTCASGVDSVKVCDSRGEEYLPCQCEGVPGGADGGIAPAPADARDATGGAGDCVARCEGRQCGPNGCGGICGTCLPTSTCDADGRCVPVPVGCGDGDCGAGESCATCPADCNPCCGDRRCDGAEGEDCRSCPADCGACCGNGLCEPAIGESCAACASDCGCAADYTCEGGACVAAWCPDADCAPLWSQDCTGNNGYTVCGIDPGDGCPAASPFVSCEPGNACRDGACSGACIHPEIVLLVDRSSSMAGDQWAYVSSALRDYADRFEGVVRLGLRTFPGNEGCAPGADVAIALDNASAIRSRLTAPSEASATPIAAALAGLAAKFGDPNQGEHVILITDGSETCGAAAEVTGAVAALRSRGVRTHAIGVGSGYDEQLLEDVAVAGGTAAVRVVTDAASLSGLLEQLTWDAGTCCLDGDGDGYGERCAAGTDCDDDAPEVHAPDCAGRDCGDDGCGGSCGICGCGQECQGHDCVFVACAGRACGDDGCGGSCGGCPAGEHCVDGACVCQRDCEGLICGDDGCGGSCGGCPPDTGCLDGTECVRWAPAGGEIIADMVTGRRWWARGRGNDGDYLRADWSTALSACSVSSRDDASWSLPTREELRQLVLAEAVDGCHLHPAFGLPCDRLWTSEHWGYGQAYAYAVSFWDGESVSENKDSRHRFMCVEVD